MIQLASYLGMHEPPTPLCFSFRSTCQSRLKRGIDAENRTVRLLIDVGSGVSAAAAMHVGMYGINISG